MARTESMATIRAALETPEPQPAPAAPPADAATTSLVPGGIEVGAPLSDQLNKLPSVSADQERGYKIARQQRMDQTAAEKQASQEASEQQRGAEQQQASTTRALVDASKRIVRGTGVQLANLPTPGGIVLPLVILAILFTLLLPVGGHTRAVWLWLVLTGEAHMAGGQETGGGAATGTQTQPKDNPPLPPTTPQDNPPLAPTLLVIGSGSFTGVEDV